MEEIYKKYQEDIYRFVRSKVKELSFVDDISQEVFIKAYLNLDSVKDKSKIKTWLLSIANREIMDHFRKKTKDRNQVYDFVENESVKQSDHSKEDCLLPIILSLPKRYKAALFLSDIKGLKQKEIADQLKLPLSTVKSQIQRARKLIKQAYVDCCGFEEGPDGTLVGEVKSLDECKVCS